MEKKKLFSKDGLMPQQILTTGIKRVPEISCLRLSVEIGTAQLNYSNK